MTTRFEREHALPARCKGAYQDPRGTIRRCRRRPPPRQKLCADCALRGKQIASWFLSLSLSGEVGGGDTTAAAG